MSETPEVISSVISQLWRISCTDETAVFSSPTFTELENSCLSVYRRIPGSRLDQNSTADSIPNELQTVLRNFFRWKGAPWYDGNVCTANEAAQMLHQTFLSKQIIRYYLVPLDRFDLQSNWPSSHDDRTYVSFGPNKILFLNSIELDRLVNAQALPRFGPNYIFPTRELGEFYWLLVTGNEGATTISFRNWLRIQHNLSVLTRRAVPIFRPNFPTPIEDALFAMLLTFVKSLDNLPWKPFYVPWFYSFTDDLFADAMHAPDPSAMTRTTIVSPGKQFKVPDRSIKFRINGREREALRLQWRQLKACQHQVSSSKKNFNMLTKRFFVKGLVENGIDQLISNVCCIEATLQLHTEKNRKNLMKRYLNLTNDAEAHEWLDNT